MTRPALILLTALALAACAAPNVDRSAADFDATTFAVDLSLCRGGNIAEASLKTIGKGALGSLAGAGVMEHHGAAAANSGEAIVVGAAIGAVIGLGVGAHDAVDEHHQEISTCLRDRGYEVVANAALGPAIEEIASNVGQTFKDGYEYTAEQIGALHRFLGDEGFYELFGGLAPKGGEE